MFHISSISHKSSPQDQTTTYYKDHGWTEILSLWYSLALNKLNGYIPPRVSLRCKFSSISCSKCPFVMAYEVFLAQKICWLKVQLYLEKTVKSKNLCIYWLKISQLINLTRWALSKVKWSKSHWRRRMVVLLRRAQVRQCSL